MLLLPACPGVIGDAPLLPDASSPPDATGPDGAPAPLVPSNIPDSLLVLGAASLTLGPEDSPIEIDTDTGSITRVRDGQSLLPAGVVFSKLAQDGDSPELGVFSATQLAIEADTLVDVRGSAALVFAIGDTVTIHGRLRAVGGLFSPSQPGPGGFAGGTAANIDGHGPGGGRYGGDEDGGGGGGGHVASGGRGGNTGANSGGPAGASHGAGSLVPLVGGSGGGLGGGGEPYDGNGQGGGGGGAVQISARTSIYIGSRGGINCGGGGGQGGILDDGGGGGGAGGAILLEAAEVHVAGTLAANGGGGGAGAHNAARGASGQGGDFSGSVSLGGPGLGEGSAGGAGGAGLLPQGGRGVDTAGVDGTDDNAGGGGGAAGRIYIRSSAGARLTGTISPLPGLAEGAL